jgi:hypothetical protein
MVWSWRLGVDADVDVDIVDGDVKDDDVAWSWVWLWWSWCTARERASYEGTTWERVVKSRGDTTYSLIATLTNIRKQFELQPRNEDEMKIKMELDQLSLHQTPTRPWPEERKSNKEEINRHANAEAYRKR